MGVENVAAQSHDRLQMGCHFINRPTKISDSLELCAGVPKNIHRLSPTELEICLNFTKSIDGNSDWMFSIQLSLFYEKNELLFIA